MAPLRVLLLPPTPRTPERAAFQPGSGPDPFALERQLAGLGIDLVTIDPGAWPLNPLAGRGSVLESLDPLRALRVMLTQRRADLVVAVFEGPALPLVLLRRLLAFRLPIVLWDLGLTETWRLRERILDRVVPRVDSVFVLGASQKPYIEARWPGARVSVLGHVVDAAFFHPVSPPPSGPVLAIGDDAGRDFPTLLAAAADLDAPVVLKTSRVPADTTLPANVTIRRDRLSPIELRRLYQDCACVVVPLHPTLNASGVSTILEAAAMGCALVVSDNPAIRDFIVPDETCLVVPCGDAAALRAAITRLLHEPQTRARLGQSARRFIERSCATPAFAERFATLLRGVVSG